MAKEAPFVLGLHLENYSAKSKIRFTTERTSSSCKGATRRSEPRAPDTRPVDRLQRAAGRWPRDFEGTDQGIDALDRSVLELGPQSGSGLEWGYSIEVEGVVELATGDVGGDEETRTPDPLLAKEMLCQLSYVPLPVEVVGVSGLEPETSALSGQCSNQLS